MFPSDVRGDAAALLAQLDSTLDGLAHLELTGHSDPQIVALWRDLEARRNRFAPLDHQLISEVQARRLDLHYGAKTTTAFARQLLRIDSRQAHARVKAAEALGPRLSVTGELLDPIFERVAEAQSRGAIGATAAQAVVQLIEHLPDATRAEKDVEVETFLVEQAEILDVDCLRKIAQRLSATLDPDGLFRDLAYRSKQRDLRVKVRSDGSGRLEAELTAEATEHVLTMLDHLARPKPAADGVKDARTPGQRRHDALLDAITLLERAEALPHTAGVAATIVLTMSESAYATGDGLATTGHGALIPAGEAKRWAGGDAKVIGVVLSNVKAVAAYSTTHRIFTEGQRLAMIARDQGCSFPGCDAPPLWTEAHHITDHAASGRTTIDDGCLLCGVHHREHQHLGYVCVMIDRLPYWIPPRWLDPDQKPVRNRAHAPLAG